MSGCSHGKGLSAENIQDAGWRIRELTDPGAPVWGERERETGALYTNTSILESLCKQTIIHLQSLPGKPTRDGWRNKDSIDTKDHNLID